jgi:hypothetical protein
MSQDLRIAANAPPWVSLTRPHDAVAFIGALATGCDPARDAASALFVDLPIAHIPRGTRQVQAFPTVRKRPEFYFQAQVLLAGFG